MRETVLAFASSLVSGRRRRIPRPSEELLGLLDRERARSDRTGVAFSLVRFLPGPDNGNPAFRKELVDYLLRRARNCDEVGWTPGDEPAVLLPGTPAPGACMFADKVCRDLAPGIRLLYIVHAYPSPDGYGEDPKDEDPQIPLPFRKPDRPSGGEFPSRRQCRERTVERVEPLLVRPPPSWKRAVDVAGSVVALILSAPLLLLLAVYIKIVSPGPVFYRQKRVGHMGRIFTIWKLRTMHPGSEDRIHNEHLRNLIHSESAAEKLDSRNDSRIILFGHLIRQLGLDEIPQLVNVLLGEMSLVGPRPCLPYEAREYQPWAARRFDAVPGMTGLWQVSGKNRTTYKEMLRLDIRYLQRISPGSDFRIMAKTVPVLLGLAAEHLALRQRRERETP